MAFNDLEFHAVKKEVEAFVESNRPPFYLRDQADLRYRIKDQSVELFLVRPAWQGKPGDVTESVMVKITYVRASKEWRLYCQRANLKWEFCDSAYTLAEALELVREDRHCCFWG